MKANQKKPRRKDRFEYFPLLFCFKKLNFLFLFYHFYFFLDANFSSDSDPEVNLGQLDTGIGRPPGKK
jgi:hypothetical protein